MRSPSITSIPILVILVAHPGVSASSWTNISKGLSGQSEGIGRLAVDPSGFTLYALGNQAFKTTDSGSHWRMLGGITSARMFVIDPVTPSNIYAGTSYGVWKSTDGGETWAFAGIPATSITSLVIDPLESCTLYAGTLSDQFYKSTDGGANWTGFSLGLSDPRYNGVASILIDPSTPSTLYLIAGGLGSPLYKSTDGAQTWSVINNGLFFRLLGVTSSTLYAILGGGPFGLSTSTDGGATWTSTGFSKDVVSMVFDPTNPNIVYGSISAPVGSPPALYTSLDGGHNWNALNTNMPFSGPLALNPANPSIIYGASHSGGVFKSSDAGKTWNAANSGLSAAGVHVLVGDPSDPSTIYAGGDGGLFKSADSGATWNLQAAFQAAGVAPPSLQPPPATGFPASAPGSVHSMLINSSTPSTVYIGTARIGGCFFTDVLLYKSVDGGTTWSDGINPSQSGCSDDALLVMDPTNPNTLYIRSGDDFDGYGLRKSIDAGVTWSYTGLYANYFYALAIESTNPSMLYAGTDNGVLRSTDGGATWNALGLSNMSVNLLTHDPALPNTLYAYGFLGIFKSTDGGTSWSLINRGLEGALANVAPVNTLIVDPEQTGVLYLATSGYGVFRSLDGGLRWAPFSDGLTNLDVRTLAITGGSLKALYAGTPGGIFRVAADPPERQAVKHRRAR